MLDALETPEAVSDRNRAAARMWGLGGRAYDAVSFRICDALAHAAQRLAARPGEAVLDVATGTGWTARNVAASGASVTGIDIADGLLSAARALSAHVEPPIDYRLTEAERLPFTDAAFDGVISTFGVMFAAGQAEAAAELARVCRPGGRLVLATWTPDGAVAQFFAMLGRHDTAPPPAASPLAWGDPDHLARLLGGDFDLRFEAGTSTAYHASNQEIWDWYKRGFGPLRALSDSLDADGAAALRADFDAYHDHYATPNGLRIAREYLVTIGTRR